MRVPILFCLLCRYVEAEPLGTRPMCSVDKQVHRTRRIIALQWVTWVTDGGMLYRIVENETSILTFYCKL